MKLYAGILPQTIELKLKQPSIYKSHRPVFVIALLRKHRVPLINPPGSLPTRFLVLFLKAASQEVWKKYRKGCAGHRRVVMNWSDGRSVNALGRGGVFRLQVGACDPVLSL